MQKLFLVSLFAGLVACGQNSENSDVAHHAPKLPSLYSFSVDARPVDGNYQNITIKKDEYGTYVATHQVITAGFGFPVSDTTEEIGSSLNCVETKKRRVLLKLECSVDLRPADGALIELTLARDSEGFYNATLRRATYATIQYPETDVTTEIAYGLKRDR